MNSPIRNDPVGDRYFTPLRTVDMWSSVLFVGSALLSFAALFVTEGPWRNGVLIAFVILVLSNFVLGFYLRLTLAPKAEEMRRRDLLSDAYSVNLTHENATGYFNNDETNPIRRLAASIMESSFFTRSISGEMLKIERFKIAVYFLLWMIAVLVRSIDLSWIAVATQTIFSEQILSKWLRLEWLNRKCETVYDRLQRLVTTANTFDNKNTHAQVLECFSEYESIKSRATIVLSDRIFRKKNPSLSKEWDRIRNSVGL